MMDGQAFFTAVEMLASHLSLIPRFFVCIVWEPVVMSEALGLLSPIREV